MVRTLNRRQISIEGIVLFFVGALMLAVGLLMLAMPDVYEAIVRIKVAPPAFPGPWFPPTEFEVIRSDLVLSEVVQKLNAAPRKKATKPVLQVQAGVASLRRRLELRLIPNTELIEILVRSEDPVEAAQVANLIAAAYLDAKQVHSQSQSKTTLSDGLKPAMIVDPMVRLIDTAVVPTIPVRPNRPLSATCALFGALLLAIFIWATRSSVHR